MNEPSIERLAVLAALDTPLGIRHSLALVPGCAYFSSFCFLTLDGNSFEIFVGFFCMYDQDVVQEL